MSRSFSVIHPCFLRTLVIPSLVIMFSSSHIAAEVVANTSEQPAKSINSVTSALAEAGVKTCLDRSEQISNFLTKSSDSQAYLFVAPEQTDQRMSSASIESKAANDVLYYSSMTTAPHADGCGGIYEAVTYFPQSCAEVEKNSYQGMTSAGVVREKIRMLSGAGTLRVFLLPAGKDGCVSIVKELIY